MPAVKTPRELMGPPIPGTRRHTLYVDLIRWHQANPNGDTYANIGADLGVSASRVANAAMDVRFFSKYTLGVPTTGNKGVSRMGLSPELLSGLLNQASHNQTRAQTQDKQLDNLADEFDAKGRHIEASALRAEAATSRNYANQQGILRDMLSHITP